MERLYRLAKAAPGYVIILLGIVWKFSVDRIASSFSQQHLGSPVPSDTTSVDFIFHEFIALFPAPILETLIYQLIPVEGFLLLTRKKTFKHKLVWAAMISSILFGSGHSYNLLTVIATSISGFALSATYIIFRKRTNSIGVGYCMAVLLHFLVNAIILIIRLV